MYFALRAKFMLNTLSWGGRDMEGTILGVDDSSGKAAIKTANGDRYYCLLAQWRGSFQPEAGMKVDFEKAADGEALNVYPMGRSPVVAMMTKPEVSKATATILALLLGGVGAHKFYLGSWGWGIVYLLFCWTWIPVILSVIECIMYIKMDDDEFQDLYARMEGPFSILRW
jgi:TM2 domain-containing membrane protein YozV